MKRRRVTHLWARVSPPSVAPSLIAALLTLPSGALAANKASQSNKAAPVSVGSYGMGASPSRAALVPRNASRSVWPLWINRQRGYIKTQALLLPPVWFRSQDLRTQSEATALLPLAYWSRSPKHRAVHTLLGSMVRSPSRRLTGVWPLASVSSQRGADLDRVILAGAFWQRKRGKDQVDHWGLGPLFWKFGRKDQRSWWVPPLLSGLSYGPKKNLQMLTPLLWHSGRKHGDAWQHRAMMGPLYAAWGPKARGLSLFPLWLHHRSEAIDFTIAPLLLTGYRRLAKDQSKTFISPLFVRHRSPGHLSTGVAGLFWDIQRPQERHTTLFPLFYRYQKAQRSGLFTPIGASWNDGKSQRHLWGPFFGHRSAKGRTLGVAPLWAHHRGQDSQLDMLAPLWLRVRTKERDLDAFTPLIWRTRVRGKNARTGFAVAPLYFQKREPTGFDVDAAPGFFWSRDARRRTHTLVVGPFYHRLSRKGLHTGIFPITWWKDSVRNRRLVVLPLIFHTENKPARTHTTVAFPLWFDRQRGPARRTWLAFPFMLGREFPHQFYRVGIGAPGALDIFSLKKNRRLTGWLPFYFRYQKCGFQKRDPEGCRYTAHGSFPLFFYGKTKNGDRLAHSALALYYYERNGARRKFFTLLGGVDREPQKRMTWYAGPVYRSITNDKIRHGVVPFYMHSRDRLVDKQTTLVLPPLFISQHREDRRWFEAGLLVWHFRSQHQVVTLLAPPIFGHQHTYAERKRNWLLPIYWDDHNMGKESRTSAIFPLLWFRARNRKGTTSIQFPFWWDFKRGEERRTRLFLPPLWFDIQRSRHHRTRMIPGLWYHRDRRRKDTTVLGPGLAWWTVHEDPDPSDAIPADRDWRALFGIFGGGRKSGRPYFSLVGKPIWLASEEAVESEDEESDEASSAADPAEGVEVKEAPVRGSGAR